MKATALGLAKRSRRDDQVVSCNCLIGRVGSEVGRLMIEFQSRRYVLE